MDKSWMSSNRQSIAYEKGVASFIKYAIKNSDNPNFIRCPCEKCVNMIYRTPREVVDHLFVNGIDGSYKDWSWHGEKTTFSCEDHYNDQNTNNDFAATVEMVHDAFRYCDNDVESLRDLLEDAEKPLYPGCSKYTKLSGLLKLYNVKGRYGWSDKSFSELLICLQDIFPEDNLLPLSIYEAKKTMSVLGVQYEKIHACPNDCILYRKNYENLVECPSCGQSRWKNQSKHIDKKKLKVPAKVLWYFPIVPRLRRLFQSPETAKDLTWHAHGRENDGMLRHPADSPSWKLVDKLWPDFASEIRNVRFALCSDGINPFGTLSSQYSCWPVILVNYNLPPWLCMKRKFLMLSLLISGPRQPGNDIDVYLAPLIDDLKILWDVGIEAYDASKQESFILRAMLMWTISDFPAYGNLSGCVTKGYYACPICKEGTAAQWLSHSNKMVYMGHRRFLPRGHSFRDKTRVFNNKVETEFPPKPLTGEQILKMVDGINCTYGKNKKKMKRKKGVSSVKGDVKVCYKKKSIFFELVYWKHLLVRHQLDVMHIEKNVCESIYGTLLNIPGKTKDGLKARLDLVELKIRPELTPKNEGSSTVLPPACFTLSREEKMKFCQTLVDIKVPEGYCSNLKNLVSMSDLKLHGLKSHDCHVLMQQILPLAIRSILPEHVRCAIIRLCFFFNSLCTNVVDPNKLDQLQLDIVETLCVLEKTFMPCFFDIMIHLTVHLVEEVRLCGPVCLRWMYPFEREMKPLKGYVRNRNRPEGCIAQCYMVEEAMEFCADFLSVLNAIGNPPGQKDMILIEKPLTSGVMVEVRHELLEQAHRYVLQNTAEVQPYIDEHMRWLKKQYPRKSKNTKWLQDQHHRTFTYWLDEKVSNAQLNDELVSNSLWWLSQGPRPNVIKYPGYLINGFYFLARDRDTNRVTQNSGVTIVANTMQIASAKDKNPVVSDMTYYGVINEIWDIDYTMFKVLVFMVDWVDSGNGVHVDDLGFTSVELDRIGHKNDLFILASQAKQVFYVPDQRDERLSVVCAMAQKVNESMANKVEGDNIIEHPPFLNEAPTVNSFDKEDDDVKIYHRPGWPSVRVDN